VAKNDTWYAPESRFWFGRVSQPSQFSPALQSTDHDILCVEIPEGRWGSSQDFLSQLDTLTTQLFQAGIIAQPVRPSHQKQTWIPRVYPMYRRGWFALWKEAMAKVSELGNVYPIGRQGLFLHCNMDHCVHISSEAVEQASTEHGVDAWLKRCPEFLDLRVRD